MTPSEMTGSETNGQPVELGDKPTFTRRQVLAGLMSAGVVTIVGTSPVAGAMKALAMPGGDDNRVLVNVFLRGGCDGLNIVVPYGDSDYYRLRPSISQARSTLSNLDGFFGLNAAFRPLNPLYQDGDLAFIQAVGSNDPTRSHFSAMDNMDLAFGSTGWMERALAVQAGGDPLAGLTIGDRTSPSLRGANGGIAIKRMNTFRQSTAALSSMRPTLESMYGASPDRLTGAATLRAFTSVDRLSGVSVRPDVQYPNNSIGRDFREAAALIKADIGVKMVSINFGGWDHHRDLENRLSTKGAQLSAALAAFKADLAGEGDRVLTLVMSEFGRTARQNGSAGTDHGHGNMMMVMGGELNRNGGGRVHMRDNRWVGLADSQLYGGRDLAISTDFRSVLSEALDRHMGIADDGRIFPGFQPQYLGLLTGGGGPPVTTPSTVPSTTPSTVPSTTPSTGPGNTSTTAAGATTTTALVVSTTTTTTTTSGGGGTATTGSSTSVPGTTPSTAPTTTATTAPSTTGSTPTPTTAPTTTTTVPGGWISGVVSYVDGKPVPGVKIDLFRSVDGMRNGFLGAVRTNEDGEYLFQAPAGPHILTFIAPSGDSFVEGKRFHQPSVLVESGQTASGINAQLLGQARTDSGSIEGTILDGQGTPVVDVKVDVFKARGDGSRGRFLRYTTSGADGAFRADLPPGCYILTMIAPDGTTFSNGRRWYQPAVCIDANEARTGVDAQLGGAG